MHRLTRLRRRQCRRCGRLHEHATQEEEEQHGQALHCIGCERRQLEPSRASLQLKLQPNPSFERRGIYRDL